MSIRISCFALALITLAFGALRQGRADWSFSGLGTLGGKSSGARAISANGSVVVGSSYNVDGDREAFRWEDGIMVGLGFPSGTGFDTRADGVSADGSLVVGNAMSAIRPFRWEDGVMTMLPTGRPPLTEASAKAISADGSVIVGNSFATTGDWRATRWVGEDAQRWVLRTLGGARSEARGVSADGSVIVGWSHTAEPQAHTEAFRWENGVIAGLGTLGTGFSLGDAVSADGAVVAGSFGDPNDELRVFRWEDGAMVSLGILPGDWTDSRAAALSADGSAIVGWFYNWRSREWGPFIWRAGHGMRSLEDVLTAGGIDLSDWELSTASGISADGRVLVGSGYNAAAGRYEAWRAVIPEPSTPAALLTLAAALALFHTLRHRQSTRTGARRNSGASF